MRVANVRGGLTVRYRERVVGALARNQEGRIVFQYDPDWLSAGFSINPYSLPLSPEVFVPEWEPFDGLFGVFNDSLPDGWGALLFDRKLRNEGIDPAEVGPLDRLSIVGASGRGHSPMSHRASLRRRLPSRTSTSLQAGAPISWPIEM